MISCSKRLLLDSFALSSWWLFCQLDGVPSIKAWWFCSYSCSSTIERSVLDNWLAPNVLGSSHARTRSGPHQQARRKHAGQQLSEDRVLGSMQKHVGPTSPKDTHKRAKPARCSCCAIGVLDLCARPVQGSICSKTLGNNVVHLKWPYVHPRSIKGNLCHLADHRSLIEAMDFAGCSTDPHPHATAIIPSINHD